MKGAGCGGGGGSDKNTFIAVMTAGDTKRVACDSILHRQYNFVINRNPDLYADWHGDGSIIRSHYQDTLVRN